MQIIQQNLVVLQVVLYAWFKIQNVSVEMQTKVDMSCTLEIHGLHQSHAQLSFGSIIKYISLVL